MGQLDDLDYYTLMGVDDHATLREIQRAFREFARKYHPDNYADRSEKRIDQATDIYRRGSEAYRILTDTKTRKAYDIALKHGHLRLSAPDVDRALAPTRPPPILRKKKPDVPIRSPQALSHYKAGIARAHAGDWQGAWRLLKEAHHLEPDNEFIASRFYRVERRLRGR